MELNKDTWNNRYLTNDIGWDIGYVSTPIKEYIDQLEDKSLRILIPGCGNSYEAEYLHKNGFTNVFVIDLAQEALNNLQARIPDFPSNHMICGNFFEHEGKYDLILEQTFFCAINPSLREEYVARMKKLIDIDGKLVGLLFNDKLFSDRPPYGGKKSDYINLFSKYFNKVSMEKAYNSVAPRKDRELFIVIC